MMSLLRAPQLLALALCAGALGVDLALEGWAQAALAEPVRVVSWLYLALHHNPGLFLGALPVSAVSVVYWLVVGAALLWMGQRMVRTQSRAIAAGYALIAGGLAGNALDRVQGAVVDYFVIGPVAEGQWLAVNASDLALLAGALILGVVMVRGMRLSRDRTGACGSRSCRAGSR